jgi:hypothetical protein
MRHTNNETHRSFYHGYTRIDTDREGHEFHELARTRRAINRKERKEHKGITNHLCLHFCAVLVGAGTIL